MPNILELKRRRSELASECNKAIGDLEHGNITRKNFEHRNRPDRSRTHAGRRGHQGLRPSAEIRRGIRPDQGMGGQPSTSPDLRAKGRAPGLPFTEADCKAMYQAVKTGQSFTMRTKGFNTGDPYLPAQMAAYIVGPQHENRLLDHLPIQPIDAPSYEYVQHL